MAKQGMAIAIGWGALVGLLACGGAGKEADTAATLGQHRAPRDHSLLEQYAATAKFVLGRPRNAAITADGTTVLFLRSARRSFVHALLAYDIATRSEKRLVTAEELLRGATEEISGAEKARRERMRLRGRGITSFSLSPASTQVLIPLAGRLFVYDLKARTWRELRSAAGYALDAEFSPDGSKIAVVRDGDLYVMELASGRESRLTRRESDTVEHGVAEFVAQEEMGRYRGFWWSPDSRRIAYQRSDHSGVERLYIFDPSRPEKPPHDQFYPRVGKRNSDVRLGLIAAQGGETTWVRWDRERYPYLARVVWQENAPLTLLVQNRRQTEELILTADPGTGATAQLHVERDEAWVNLDYGELTVPFWLSDGRGFLWTTEHRGAWQLELRDRRGKLMHAVTEPSLGYRDLLHVDESGNAAYVAASPDPREQHVYQVPLDPAAGKAKRLTSGSGIHSMVLAKTSTVRVHEIDDREGDARILIEGASGEVVGRLRSDSETPLVRPRVEYVMASDGERQFHAAIIRPRDYEPGRRYPVLVHVYGGPHKQMVTAKLSDYVLDQWLADQGFVVVIADGRGTPNRGRAWERAIKFDYMTIPLQDQVSVLADLGRAHPELDLDRVGIFGWSFGGYFSAMAVMRRPDIFHVAVVGAPTVDQRDYDTHYTERYLGLPADNPDGYQRCNALTYAAGLRRPLLLIHGTDDDNVYFTHGVKLSNALFRAGKAHNFLVLAGRTHMVNEPGTLQHLYVQMADFLAKELGHEPGRRVAGSRPARGRAPGARLRLSPAGPGGYRGSPSP